MNKITEIVDYVLIGTGVTVSLSDIHQILSIIILVFNVVWILTKCGIKIYQKVKEKRYTEIAEDIKNTADELQDLDNSIKDKKEDSHGEK